MLAHAFARAFGVAGAACFVGFGVWGMAAPRTFFERFATFEPYNQHLIQDIGAFRVFAVLAALLVAAGVLSWVASRGGVRAGQ